MFRGEEGVKSKVRRFIGRTAMKERILIIEDDPRNMRLLEMTLKAKGYTLLEATDGGEALDMAIRERPDLIIMDIQLPKINGLAVTKKLRKTPGFEDTPIIAITAYAMKGDRERAVEAGCNAYLPKPINIRELPEVIAAMLLQRQRDNIPTPMK
jgi:CheY-like chemotaxis protein